MTTPTMVKEPGSDRSVRGMAEASRVSWLFMPRRLAKMERTIEGMDCMMPMMPAPAMPPTPMMRT